MITNLNSIQPAVMITRSRWDSTKKPKFEINLTNVANIINVINYDMNAVWQTTCAINSITNKLSNVIIDCDLTKTKVLVFSRSKIRFCKLRTFKFGKISLNK